jgi:hypothetical protein
MKELLRIIYLPICASTVLVDLGHSRYDSLDGGSASRKASIYTQSNIIIE